MANKQHKAVPKVTTKQLLECIADIVEIDRGISKLKGERTQAVKDAWKNALSKGAFLPRLVSKLNQHLEQQCAGKSSM